jgi:pyruvate,water dikinase
MQYIRKFKTLQLKDVLLVGGKNASLGHMLHSLSMSGVRVPAGFAVTVDAYRDHLKTNNLLPEVTLLIKKLRRMSDFAAIKKVGKQLRDVLENAPLSVELIKEITESYEALSQEADCIDCVVAVRSSATAEDLPDASFAGQQESFLNVSGIKQVLAAYKKCLASLFTDRAIMYRAEKGFDHLAVGISVGIQQMVRSDRATSGVMFTLDTESGFKDVVVISSSYGMGESVVKGEVVPDEFHVFKPLLTKGLTPIIKRECGSKIKERVCSSKKAGTILRPVSLERAQKFSLSDAQVIELAKTACIIEKEYEQVRGSWTPMDIEWAYDGDSGLLYIVQARPETVHAQREQGHSMTTYRIASHQKTTVLVKGQSVGQKIAVGRARVITSMHEGLLSLEEGEILVTRMTDPDWVPLMKKAAGIITENGGRTCHAAIVSRELGIPAIVGAAAAMKKIQDGQYVTLDCSTGSEGVVYEGILAIEKEQTALGALPKTPVKVLLNVASPERAYTYSALPVDGVGLARLEFIITNAVQVHPMALIVPEKIQDKKVLKKLQEVTASYASPHDFFIKKVAEGVGMIAASFFPRPVLVRFSDFKSNEYRGLLGGSYFEPTEENPMMGWRGASRYYHESYAPAFELECQAIRYAREVMGLHNINVMIPFVRTVEEARKVTELLKKQGLVSQRGGLEIYMMCEIPSNVLLIEQFAQYFDGFSIGSNDLTQTTLSVDRDSGLLATVFDERNEAVMKMMSLAIHGSHFAGKPIGICGQAPSDYPEIAQFLMDEGINSISLNPDSVIPFLSTFGKPSVEDFSSGLKNKDSIIPAQIA